MSASTEDLTGLTGWVADVVSALGPIGVGLLVAVESIFPPIPSDVERAEGWFDRHGGTAVLIGRCVPVVRSLISIPAGVERMPLWRFSLYTLIGSAVWNAALVLGGFALGSRFGQIGRYSDYINYAVYALIAFFLLRFVTRRRRQRSS